MRGTSGLKARRTTAKALECSTRGLPVAIARILGTAGRETSVLVLFLFLFFFSFFLFWFLFLLPFLAATALPAVVSAVFSF
jgi:hypothetical protein